VNSFKWPYRPIVRLDMKCRLESDPNGELFPYQGSGTMIGPRHVLSCGHNIRSRRTTGPIEVSVEITVVGTSFREEGKEEFTLSAKVVAAWVPEQWFSAFDKKHDLSLLVLDTNIGMQTGWLGLATWNKEDGVEQKRTFEVSGYPGEVIRPYELAKVQAKSATSSTLSVVTIREPPVKLTVGTVADLSVEVGQHVALRYDDNVAYLVVPNAEVKEITNKINHPEKVKNFVVDQHEGELVTTNKHQFTTTLGNVEMQGDEVFKHTLDTSPGDSGSAIFSKFYQNGWPLICGVHRAGTTPNTLPNFGSRLNGARFDFILKWLAANWR